MHSGIKNDLLIPTNGAKSFSCMSLSGFPAFNRAFPARRRPSWPAHKDLIKISCIKLTQSEKYDILKQIMLKYYGFINNIIDNFQEYIFAFCFNLSSIILLDKSNIDILFRVQKPLIFLMFPVIKFYRNIQLIISIADQFRHH